MSVDIATHELHLRCSQVHVLYSIIDQLTLMKGDEVVELVEKCADLPLFCHLRYGHLNLHHLSLGDVEARYALSEQLDVFTHRFGPQHVCEVVRVEAAVLSVAEAETVQIEIVEVREPNGGHAYLFGSLRRHREEGITVQHAILARIHLDLAEPRRIGNGVIEDVRVRNETSVTMAEVFFCLPGKATVSRAHLTQLTLFPRKS